MATGYPYLPLNPQRNEIRLLSIRQRPPRKKKLLEFRLRHARLDNVDQPPDYVAISYVWGDATQPRDIIVDGKRISVPQNAEIALRYLHRAMMTSRPKGLRPKQFNPWPSPREVTFWIDSVCIDQFNLKERGQQVAIMWRIYSSASFVLIWLGHSDEHTATAIHEIEKVADEGRRETNNLENLYTTLWESREDGTLVPKSEEASLNHLNWSAIESFYSSPWFRRLWVFQEACLAKCAYFICGEHVTPWSSLALANDWLRYRLYSSRSNLGKFLPGIENAERMQRFRAGQLDPLEALVRAYQFEVSDPLDRVYGFLGLFQSRVEYADLLLDIGLPDYTADLRNVYSKITKHYIHRFTNLDALWCVQIYRDPLKNTKEVDTPSWAIQLHRETLKDACPLRRPCPSVGSNNKIPLQLDQVGSDLFTLALRGCVVDRVKARANGAMQWESWTEVQTVIKENYEIAQAHGCCTDEAFGRTMLVDSRGLSSKGKCSLTEWPLFLRWCHRIGEDGDYTAHYYAHFIVNNSAYRRFFVTGKGLIGMGTSDIEEGDHVCILFGGKVPYILRQREDSADSWTFIGDAYVDGIMNGEYIQRLQDEGRLESETRLFNLR